METERGVPNILGGGLMGGSLLIFAVAVADLVNVLDAPCPPASTPSSG